MIDNRYKWFFKISHFRYLRSLITRILRESKVQKCRKSKIENRIPKLNSIYWENRFHNGVAIPFWKLRAFPFVLELTIGMLRLRLYYEIVWDSYDLTSFHLTYFTLALDQIVKSKSALNIFLISIFKKKNF